jgi:hypothetical protein
VSDDQPFPVRAGEEWFLKNDFVRGMSTLNPGLMAAVVGTGVLLLPYMGIGALLATAGVIVTSAAIMGAVTKPRKK